VGGSVGNLILFREAEWKRELDTEDTVSYPLRARLAYGEGTAGGPVRRSNGVELTGKSTNRCEL
jgi:hypothetical protein